MKFLKAYETKKWLLFGLPILAMCVIMACSKDDGKTDDTTDDITGGTDDDPTPAMTFTDFDPKQGEAGVTTVTLTGTNFSTTPSENSVKFGTAAATVTDAKASQLQVTVPATAQTGTISVTTNGTKVTSTDTFTVEDPEPQMVITGFDPPEGEWGDLVKVNGVNFGTDPSAISVQVNGVTASKDAFGPDFIYIEIPDGARTGKVILTKEEQTVESENDFTVFHGSWTSVADFGGGKRTGAFAFAVNGKGYVGTGVYDSDIFRDVWEYDPTVNGWNEMENNFGGGFRNASVAFTIDDAAYVMNGAVGTTLINDFWHYGQESDTWSEPPGFLGEARRLAVAFSINGKGYVGTGRNQNQDLLKTFWEYDPAQGEGTWSQKADLGGAEAVGRFFASGFSIGNKGYIGTGFDDNDVFLKDFWEYDPSDNTWTEKASVGDGSVKGRSNATGFCLGSKGYIGLGANNNGVNHLNDFWEYDPNTNSWVRVADYPGDARQGAIAFVIDGKAYVGLGSGNNNADFSDFWVFDPGNCA